MFLVAYSRMELFDTFTGPLVLHMVLVVLAFPFTNSYLFLLMRWGPWDNRTQLWNTLWFWRTMLQFLLVTGSHALGAYTASAAVKQYREVGRWEKATLVQTVYSGGHKWKNFSEHLEDRQSTVVAPELSYRSIEYKDSDDVSVMFLLEEFFAVFILLVEILHLIEEVTPKLLKNAFWNEGGADSEEFVLSNGAGFSSRHRDMSIMVQHILFEVQKMDKPPRSVQGGNVAEYNSKPLSVLTAYVPVPFMLIFQVCILVAGVSRAFPSAHLSMHVSINNGLIGRMRW